MKRFKKYKFHFIFFLGFVLVILNLKASKRLYFGYSLLENPGDSQWEAVLESLEKKEREKYFVCCVEKSIKEKLQKSEQKDREKIAKLDQGLKLNPYNWQVMLELARLYRKQGDERRVVEIERKLNDLFSDINTIKSLAR